ncbi:hypothetical protein CWI37_0403p0020 [Hamiltosporidium tvaerminnensis]|uniref:Uncharacterized protein n=1 Tax=Hamiltosporidium tvaerminnensis TaxID=1176355 RepID=A0A4Q9L5J3_9MICR|nr:hypothetical protein CWI37_0403p0020 [Hamiltosporidium tvaerminnensis]
MVSCRRIGTGRRGYGVKRVDWQVLLDLLGVIVDAFLDGPPGDYKNSISIAPSSAKSKGRVVYLHSMALYIKSYKSLPLKVRNHNEVNSFALFYDKKYIAKILSDKNLKTNIIPRLIFKINESDQNIFEKNNKAIYLLYFTEIHSILFELRQNCFLTVNNKIFKEIEYSLQRLSISERNLEFTELFISKLQEYDTDEHFYLIFEIFSELLKVIDRNFDFNYDVHLVFEDLARIDLRDVIKEHYNTHLASKAGSSSRFTTCETRIFDIETRLISMFVMVFRDLLDHIFCDKSPKISKNIENFNDEISLEDSLKAIVLDLF